MSRAFLAVPDGLADRRFVSPDVKPLHKEVPNGECDDELNRLACGALDGHNRMSIPL